MTEASPPLRLLPSVDRVVAELRRRGLLEEFPRRVATLASQQAVAEARRALQEGERGVDPEAVVDPGAIVDRAAALLRRQFGDGLRRVINASGIILHTNLGRAPLSRAAQAAVEAVSSGYSSLEIDLESGERSNRAVHVEPLLIALTGAEAGFAVNNAASAVVLALAALAAGRQVLVGRGELVEIGGGFRLPDVMHSSGARLVEVGTTNRTYLSDYAAALGPDAAMLLKVHRSNFAQSGFVHDATLPELVELGRRRGVPVVHDLGSGCLVETARVGLPAEPTVQASVAEGPDLVIFSGDKLLGGPQAGLLVGRHAAVDRCRSHPLARAARLDKMDLAALAATLRAYLEPDRAWREIPILALLARTPEARRRLALRLARAIKKGIGEVASVDVVDTCGEAGGGTLPGADIPSWAVRIRPSSTRPEEWASRLRMGSTSVVGVLREGALLLDVLAVLPGEDRRLPALVRAAAPAR
ncbi:MAG: L-seryl-tRNA(Sec) selenium transferase [Armatimonadetes bacterium]|nr:L-seryl-tRNA(Sec) selenium transferase [Armatimonadota bacterium]